MPDPAYASRGLADRVVLADRREGQRASELMRNGREVTGFVQDAASEFVCDDGRGGYRAVVLCVAYCGFETRHEALSFVAAKYAQLAYEERAAFYASQRARLDAAREATP